MKLSNVFHFALFAVSIIASPIPSTFAIEERQAQAQDLLGVKVKQVIDTVVDKTNALAKAVGNFKGDINDAPAILEASSALQTAIQDGTATVQNSLSLSLSGVLVILPSVVSLNTAVEGVSYTIVNKKSVIDKAELTAVVLDQLKAQQAAAQSLVNVLITKLPPYLPTGLGEILSAPSLKALAAAIFVYSH
jgi:hypothetical protein